MPDFFSLAVRFGSLPENQTQTESLALCILESTRVSIQQTISEMLFKCWLRLHQLIFAKQENKVSSTESASFISPRSPGSPCLFVTLAFSTPILDRCGCFLLWTLHASCWPHLEKTTCMCRWVSLQSWKFVIDTWPLFCVSLVNRLSISHLDIWCGSCVSFSSQAMWQCLRLLALSGSISPESLKSPLENNA